jgi:TM2 domain-containing membrane protein YozV
MLFEYIKFILDCVVQAGIVVVLCGLTVTMIAFLGGFIFWLVEKARSEKWED